MVKPCVKRLGQIDFTVERYHDQQSIWTGDIAVVLLTCEELLNLLALKKRYPDLKVTDTELEQEQLPGERR